MKCDCKLYLCGDNGNKFFGLGPLLLLERVFELGSLKKAADTMDLSYHKALRIIKAAEQGFGCPLLIKKVGGEKGGGSVLTPAAIKIIKNYRAFAAALNQSAQSLFAEHFKSEE